MIAATLLIASLAAAPKAAPTPEEINASRAKHAFLAAQKLYKDAKYPEAIEKFEEANRLSPHPSIIFNIARCYEQVGDVPKALRHYRDYLHATPQASDRQLVVDSIVTLERNLKERGVQQVLVVSEPPGAVAAIDGKVFGSTPASIELRPGNHTASLTHEGYEKVERPFVMPADRSFDVLMVMKPVGSAPLADSKPVEPAKTTGGAKPVEPTAAATSPQARPTTVTATSSSGSALRPISWVPAAAGLVLVGLGAGFYGTAKSAESRLLSGDDTLLNPGARSELKRSGAANQSLGFVLGGVGVAALAAAAVMFVIPGRSPVAVSVVATPSSGAAVFSGAFP